VAQAGELSRQVQVFAAVSVHNHEFQPAVSIDNRQNVLEVFECLASRPAPKGHNENDATANRTDNRAIGCGHKSHPLAMRSWNTAERLNSVERIHERTSQAQWAGKK
jgi:hypothetical protein